MLPYVKLQLCYGILAAAITLLLFLLTGRSERLVRSPALRLLSVQALLAVICLLAVPLIRRLDDVSSAFLAVAVALYGGAFWAPALASFAALRAPALRRVPVFSLSAACVLLALLALFVEPNRLDVRAETIATARWPAGSPRFRIVHISDLQTVGINDRERRAVRLINEAGPDLIVFSGDYFAGPFWDPGPAMESARTFLSSLRARHGVVAVSGHSEPGPLRRRLFRGLDIVYLENEGHRIHLEDGRSILLYGPDVEHPSIPRDFPDEPGLLTVVASHEPGLTPSLTGKGVDLHLAGHTHGGQVSLPFFGPPLTLSSLPRRYARGLFRYEDHWLNVSAGIGMEGNHAPRIRFLCPPEICVIDIEGSALVDSAPAGR